MSPSQNGYHQENKQQMLVRMQGKGTLIHYWLVSTATVEINMEVPQITETKTTI
jgi:hypothetical protein